MRGLQCRRIRIVHAHGGNFDHPSYRVRCRTRFCDHGRINLHALEHADADVALADFGSLVHPLLIPITDRAGNLILEFGNPDAKFCSANGTLLATGYHAS